MALVAESDLSGALGVGTKAVQLRAVSENWPMIRQKKQGGTERLYITDLLPVKVQQSLVNIYDPKRLHHRPVPEKSKEMGLAKYQLVKAWRLAKENAPWGGKSQAASDFLTGYNAGVLMPDVFSLVGAVASKTLDALDKKLRDHNDDYLSLCDGRGGWQKHGTNKYKNRNLSEQAKAIFLKCYLHAARPSVIMAIRATWMTLEKNGSQERPGEATFRRWLKDFERMHAGVVCMARDGVKAYTDNFGPYGTRDASLLKVGQVLVADGKTLNFTILHPENKRPVRMKLILFFDWASRYPAGWQIMPEENSIAIMAAFRNAAQALGKYPDCVYLDNGKAFKAKIFTETDPDMDALTGLYARVGTATTFAKPYNGRAKVVERFFLIFQDQFEFMMPSFCGDSIQNKPAWLHRNEKFHQAIHEARTSNWVPTIREASHIIDAYMRWYADQPHEDLPGTPAQIFLEGRGHGIDPVQLNYDFLWREDRLPDRCRVKLWGIDYESDCLHNLSKKEKIVIKYDTADLSKIWCYTSAGAYIGEAYPVQALHPMAGLFGDQVSVNMVKAHNKRMARLKKGVRQNLKDLGISQESQDALAVLPFAEKAPIIPSPAQPESTKKPAKTLAEKDIKRLQTAAAQAKKEKDHIDIPRPKFWQSELEHYEWCFSVINKHRQPLSTEDKGFMTEFESGPGFSIHRDRFEDLKLIYNSK